VAGALVLGGCRQHSEPASARFSRAPTAAAQTDQSAKTPAQPASPKEAATTRGVRRRPAAVPTGEPTVAGKHALLIGIRAYEHPRLRALRYTENDVEEMAKLLQGKEEGFASVRLLTTTRGQADPADAPTLANIRAAVADLLHHRHKRDLVLIALAGHGLQLEVNGKHENFFCPADGRLDRRTLLGLAELYKELDDSGAGVKLLLVDACREELGAAARSLDAYAAPRPPRGTAALYSCSAGQLSYETPKLGKGHGLFFYFVIEALRGRVRNDEDEVTWDELAAYVKRRVPRAAAAVIGGGARQSPHLVADLTGEPPVLRRLARGERPAPASPPPAPAPAPPRPAGPAREVVNSIGMRLRRIPAGTFTMGSPKDEVDREYFYGARENQRVVTIARPFYLGAYEVTQGEYRRVMGSNPSFFSPTGGGRKVVARWNTSRFPVERVSWYDALAFCKKLSELPAEKSAGRVYRLPSEAEWEYGCRAGSPRYHPFAFGNALSSFQANFNGNIPYGGARRGVNLKRPTWVGSYAPNAWGLYDMHGNVAEWCARDEPVGASGAGAGASKIRCVLRGGGWRGCGRDCRSAYRHMVRGDNGLNDAGFRVLVEAAPTP
jgi:formylglycine-generating enzyme required for sulfatase activity